MSILKKIFIALGTLAVTAAVVAEAALWLFYPQPDGVETRFVFQQQMTGLRPRVEYVADDRLRRTLNCDVAAKKPGSKRMVCIGGGSTDLFMHNAEDTWWGLLWKRMGEQLPVEVECVTYGAGSNEIIHGARWLQDHIRELDPDLVIVTYGLADVLQEGVAYRYDPDKFSALQPDSRPLWKRLASRYSQVYRYLRLERQQRDLARRQTGVEKPGFLTDLFRQRRLAYASLPLVAEVKRDFRHDTLVEYLDGIDRFIEICEAANVSLLVVGEAALNSAGLGLEELDLLQVPIRVGPGGEEFARPDPGWVESELERFYVAAAARCRDVGIPFISLNGVIPRSSAFFLDDNLLTLDGCARAADALTPAVTAALSRLPFTSGGLHTEPARSDAEASDQERNSGSQFALKARDFLTDSPRNDVAAAAK